MEELKQVGRDLFKYPNPQAVIHTVLKRLANSESEEVEEALVENKRVYRSPPLTVSASKADAGDPCQSRTFERGG